MIYDNYSMKNLLKVFLGLFIGSSANAMSERYEASMNFDMENVSAFLQELNTKFELSINVEELTKFTSSTPVEAEKSIVIDLSNAEKMEFKVFMDDVDAPDIYMFFERQEIADKVDKFMLEWAESKGM